MEKLAVLISIPHGGMHIPVELEDKLEIGKQEIFEDIDPFTQQIYDLNDKVSYVIKTDIARTFVDQSRSTDDLPPENPDGVIKSHTCFGKKIYKDDQQPINLEIKSLLTKYYQPFHNELQETIETNKNSLKICLDCHTMAEKGPTISPDPGKKRPTFCLGNRFGKSSSNETVQKLRRCFIDAFNLDEIDVTINNPFAGGFITRHYGKNPLPWIQVEMNRALYLKEPFFDSETLKISDDKIEELNRKFYLTLQNFFS